MKQYKISDIGIEEATSAVLRNLLENKVVSSLLVPKQVPSGKIISQALIANPNHLNSIYPHTVVIPVNSAKLVSLLTFHKLITHKKVGVVLKPCEIKAVIELAKLKMVDRQCLFIIGVDCAGTLSVTDYEEISDTNPAQLIKDFRERKIIDEEVEDKKYNLRSACKVCLYPAPENCELILGFYGQEKGELIVGYEEDLAEKDKIIPEGFKQYDKKSREEIIANIKTIRLKRREELIKETLKNFSSPEKFMNEFATCIRCYNCREVCPICYCRECVLDTKLFEHSLDQYLLWAERKGALKMPTDTLMYHLTRLNHIASSCVACGFCSISCPNNLPIFELFLSIGDKVQKLFDYIPGRSIEDEIPQFCFRENELSDLS